MCCCYQVTDEKDILCNLYGSPRYARFVQGLGELLHLRDTDPDRVHVGGLALNGSDGEFAYSWQDESMQGIQIYKSAFPCSPLLP